MNPVVIVHFVAAILAIAAAVPLMRGAVKMNSWYGVRIPAAFESEESWLDLNRYGVRLLFQWGLCIAATALVGSQLRKNAWVTYDWAALVIVMGGLALVIALIFRHARKKKSGGRPNDL